MKEPFDACLTRSVSQTGCSPDPGRLRDEASGIRHLCLTTCSWLFPLTRGSGRLSVGLKAKLVIIPTTKAVTAAATKDLVENMRDLPWKRGQCNLNHDGIDSEQTLNPVSGRVNFSSKQIMNTIAQAS